MTQQTIDTQLLERDKSGLKPSTFWGVTVRTIYKKKKKEEEEEEEEEIKKKKKKNDNETNNNNDDGDYNKTIITI